MLYEPYGSENEEKVGYDISVNFIFNLNFLTTNIDNYLVRHVCSQRGYLWIIRKEEKHRENVFLCELL